MDSAEKPSGPTTERRKRRWEDVDDTANNDDATSAAPSAVTGGGPAAVDVRAQLEAAKRQALIAAKIQAMKTATAAAAASLGIPPSSASLKAPVAPGWVPLKVDHLGRQIDDAGNVVETKRGASLSTLKVNERQAKEIEEKEVERERAFQEKANENKLTAVSMFFDPSLNAGSTGGRKARDTLHFVKPGTYAKKAEALRMNQFKYQFNQSRKDRQKSEEEKNMALGEAAEEDSSHLEMVSLPPVPTIEWWDNPIINKLDDGGNEKAYSCGINTSAITNLIHNPKRLAPVAELPAPPVQAVMLTDKERKKMRRASRMEKMKEQQDLVRFGLIPAPEPKLKLTNMMRVLADEAMADPTALEAKVRKQMADRVRKHEAANEARKLTKEQKAAKKREKLKEDTSVEVHVALFRAGALEGGRRRFLIDMNAQQYNLTGCAIVQGECNLVLFEGGPKGIKQLSKLLLRRIKWEEPEVLKNDGKAEVDEEELRGDSDDDDDDGGSGSGKKGSQCVLVWEGTLAKAAFRNFRFEVCPTQTMAKAYLQKHGVSHYWDMCINYHDPLDSMFF